MEKDSEKYDKLFDEVSAAHSRLISIWDEVGFDKEEKNRRASHVFTLLMEQLKKLEDRENKIKQQLIQSIDETALKLCNLSKSLNISNVAEPEISMTYIDLEKYLKDQVDLLQKEADRRCKILEDLRDQEKDLCMKMDEDDCTLPEDDIPSEETIAYLQTIVNTLKSDCEQRFRQFKTFKAAILCHMEELELEPSSNLEFEIISKEDELVVLSNNKLNAMKNLCKELQVKVNYNRDKEKSLQQEINLLWERLSIALEEREQFLNTLTGNATRNIPKLNEQLSYLKMLRQQNLGHFINQLRREIEDYWEMCYVSEDEKESFAPYFSDEYTEENLILHEQEANKLKEFYSENEKIFKMIKSWKDLWVKVIELDQKANDPNRLFGNRGCSLLQEEKERKKINAELPRLEKVLERQISLWEQENGRPLFICGQTLNNFIQSHWNEYNDKKQREKEIRQVTRNQQLKRDARLGTHVSPLKRRNVTRVESLRSSKYLKNNEQNRTPMTPSFFSTTTTQLRTQMKPKEQSILSSDSGQKTLSTSVLSSYDKFAQGIQRKVTKRENIRSSIVPGARLTPQTLPRRAGANRPPLAPHNRQNYTPTTGRPKIQPRTAPRRRSLRLQASTGASPSKSRSSPFTSSRLATPIRNRLNFLM